MPTEQQPRLIIDLTPFSTTNPKPLFDAVRAQLLDGPALQPVVLIVTPALYDALPRSFDEFDWLRTEQQTLDGAAVRIAELASGGALIASPVRQPLERWLAIHFEGSTLTTGPVDGLARFAADAALPVPLVEHNLSEFVDAQQLPDVQLEIDPVLLRMQIITLIKVESADHTYPDPLRRLAMARALGIEAVATPRDRVEAELRRTTTQLGLAVPLKKLTRDELEQELKRASRRRVGPLVVRVDDELHSVNPEQETAESARLHVHRIVPPPNALTRLRSEIASWTEGDFEADPFFNELIARVDPEQKEALAMLHARAWLLAANDFKPRAPRAVENWREEVRALFEQPVPVSELLVANDGKFERPPELDARSETLVRELMHQRCNHKSVVVDRTKTRAMQESVRAISGSPDVRGVSVRFTGDDNWLDVFEQYVDGNSQPARTYRSFSVLRLSVDRWRFVDAELERVWLALRFALTTPRAVLCSDQSVLLQLGGGLVAKLVVTRTEVESRQLRAFLDDTGELMTNVAPSIKVEYSVPTRVVILGGTTRVELRFSFSSLLLGGALGLEQLASNRPD